METPCWCPSEGHKHGGHKVAETSVIEFLLFKRKFVTLELRNIKINTSSRARTIQLAKNVRDDSFFDLRKNLLGPPFDATQRIN